LTTFDRKAPAKSDKHSKHMKERSDRQLSFKRRQKNPPRVSRSVYFPSAVRIFRLCRLS
jgi:hypothetical protein